MCGLAGLARFDTDARAGTPDPENILPGVVRRIEHRGPDGSVVGPNSGNVRLGFARLSLVGLDNGQQPLVLPDGSVHLVANGEVYNHTELEQKYGVIPRSKSDCEVLLHLYKRHGLDFLKEVRGMVSVAIWDRRKNLVILARDPFGIKPLFFHSNTERVIFASQSTALFDEPSTPRQIDWEAGLRDQLITSTATFSAEPLTSWFEDIRLVEPGSAVVFDLATGATHDHQYWSLPTQPDLTWTDENAFVDEYHRLFARSVSDCETADVPVGLFLSGGIDSAAIAALSQNSPHTYTALNASTLLNGDAQAAIQVATHLDLENEQIRFAEADIPGPDRYLDFLWLMETPMAGPESYYKHEMYRYVQKMTPRVKAMMIGGGADEFNGGYSSSFTDQGWSDFEAMLNAMVSNTVAEEDPRWAAWSAAGLPLIRADISRDITHLAIEDSYAAFLRWKYRDATLYNVWHEDRTAAGSGVEARVPFLDRELVEHSARVPPSLRPGLAWDKEMLRRGMRSILPEGIVHRVKVPFFYGQGVSHTYRAFGQMILADRAGLIERAVSTPGAAEFLDPDALRRAAHSCVDDPADGQLEMLLRTLNLGLLDEMAQSGRPAHVQSPRHPVPEQIRIGENSVLRSLRGAVGLSDRIPATEIAQLGQDVELLTRMDSSTVLVAVNGRLEFELDPEDDALWLGTLLASDGTKTFGDLLHEHDLIELLPLYEECVRDDILLVTSPEAVEDRVGTLEIEPPKQEAMPPVGVERRDMQREPSEVHRHEVLCRPLDVRLRNFRGTTFMAVGEQAVELDPVGAFVVKQFDGQRTIADVADAVVDEFSVGLDAATEDVSDLVASMLTEGMLSRARPL